MSSSGRNARKHTRPRAHACLHAHAPSAPPATYPEERFLSSCYDRKCRHICFLWQGSTDLVTIRLRPSCSHAVSASVFEKTSHRVEAGIQLHVVRWKRRRVSSQLLFTNFLGCDDKITRAKRKEKKRTLGCSRIA